MVVSTDKIWGFASLLYTLPGVGEQLCWRFFIKQLYWSFLYLTAELEFLPFTTCVGVFIQQLCWRFFHSLPVLGFLHGRLLITCLLALLLMLACLSHSLSMAG